jgi:hypothetical protein
MLTFGEAAVAPGIAARPPVAPAVAAAGAVDAKFIEDGDAAGVSPAIATASGFDCAAGCAGVAERAIAELSSGGFSCFHQAKRGPDWHPAAAIATNDNAAT